MKRNKTTDFNRSRTVGAVRIPGATRSMHPYGLTISDATSLVITNPDASAALKIIQQGNAPTSITTGGAINLDNSASTGAGFVLYSSRGSDQSGRLLVLNVPNSAFAQSAMHVAYAGNSHAVSVLHSSQGSNAQAYNITSTNQNDTAFGVSGTEIGKGTIKVVHNYPGVADASASALSIRVNGQGTQAQGIFFDSDDADLTGNILTLRNHGADRLILNAAGQLQLKTDGNTGGLKAGAALDVAFFRGAADTWRSDDLIQVVRSLATSACYQATVSGMSPGPFMIYADGKHEWGQGNNPRTAFLLYLADYQLRTNGMLQAVDGIATKVKAGVPVDSDFLTIAAPVPGTVPDGALAVDTTNDKLWYRRSGTWRSTQSRKDLILSAQGLIAETMERAMTVNTLAPTSGDIYFGLVALRAGDVITNGWIKATAGGATFTQSLMGLYDAAGNRLAVSADFSGALGTAGLKSVAFITPYTVTVEGAYYIAVMIQATTPPTLIRGTGQTSELVGAGIYPFARMVTQNALPVSVTYASASVAFWMGLN